MTIQFLNVQEAQKHIDEITEVYRSVYTLEPYLEPEEKSLRFKEHVPLYFERQGFVFCAAIDDQEKLQGFCFGWDSVDGGKLNTSVKELLGEKAKSWLTDCFEIVELAVHVDAQGQGTGKALFETILNHVNHKNSLLRTHTAETVAAKMYIKQGWETIVDSYKVDNDKYLRIMGKRLA